MKKNIFFAAIMLMSFTVGAQYDYKYYEYYANSGFWGHDYLLIYEMKIFSQKEKEKTADAGISGFTQTIKKKNKEWLDKTVKYDKKGNCISAAFSKKNGKISRQYSFTYSPENRPLSKIIINRKGKEIKKKTWTYTQDSLISEWVFYRKGKEIKRKKYSFDILGNITESEYIKKGVKNKSKTVARYDSTRILEYYYYRKGSPDYKKKWIYTYYPDKSMKSLVVYNKKDKVKHIYNYECKPEGELLSRHKDTTMVCEKTEYDTDSNKTVTTRRYNEKGKPVKYVYVYTKDKKLWKSAYYWGLKEIPGYKSTYRKGTDDLEEYINYNRKGIETWKTIYTFDSDNNKTGYISYRKGKFISKLAKQYNPQKFVISEEYYNKKNVLEDTYKYEYSFY